jgi:transposase
MESSTSTVTVDAREWSILQANSASLEARNQHLEARLEELTRQLEWFKRQLFGERSERRLIGPDARQLSLGEMGVAPATPPTSTTAVQAHTRTRTRSSQDEPPVRFDDTVPVEVIELADPQIEGIEASDLELISEKVTHRLAQRPGSYVILRYVRRVLKRRDTGTIHCAPAPAGVLERSFADVSFLAGLVTDKFCYHLPLYRQHQRLKAAGITVSRQWLTQLVHRTGNLLTPIAAAQLEHIRAGRVIAMDETPIKAGRKAKGKMKTGYFWPVYGEADEVSFLYCPSRGAHHVHEILGKPPDPGNRVLLSDGYSAYEQYAAKTGITHAQCWAHTRRLFYEAEAVEPGHVAEALERIGTLYEHEKQIRARRLKGEDKRQHRIEHERPLVDSFFEWVTNTLNDRGLLPTNPLTKALGYARERQAALEVFLTDPDVAIDTNHLERALRPIPMGRKSWLFCWTEIGAEHVATLQSLLVSCKLHEIHPYDYLVDVLQRIDRHPASKVEQLTPRSWKQHFADNPLRSALHAKAS